MFKRIENYDEWGSVAKELSREEPGLEEYMRTVHTLLSYFLLPTDARILDYGCGAGGLTLDLKRRFEQLKAFDISPEMRASTAAKIDEKNIFSHRQDIPEAEFEAIVCSRVLCIVNDRMAVSILEHIHSLLRIKGALLVSICNPEIFRVHESRQDYRFPHGEDYDENHTYIKHKKHGGYEIVEYHRPISWYLLHAWRAGFRLRLVDTTPEYEMLENYISDFVIFALEKR